MSAQLTCQIGNPDEPTTVFLGEDPGANNLSLTIATTEEVFFLPADPVGYEQAPSAAGSLLYLNLSSLGLADSELGRLNASSGWTARFDPGSKMLCLAPTERQTLGPSSELAIPIGGFVLPRPPSTPAALQLSLSYFRVEGVDALPYLDVCTYFVATARRSAADAADLREALQLSIPEIWVGTLPDRTPGQDEKPYGNIINHLSLLFSPGPKPVQVVGGDETMFVLTFVYGKAPGYGALMAAAAARPEVGGKGVRVSRGINAEGWIVDPPGNEETPSWVLRLPRGKPLLGKGAAATVAFAIGNIVTDFRPGPTLMMVSSSGVPGYADASFAIPLVKIPHVDVADFAADPPAPRLVDGGAQTLLSWKAENAGALRLTSRDGKLDVDVTGSASYRVRLTETTEYALRAEGLYLASRNNVAQKLRKVEIVPQIQFDAAFASGILRMKWRIKGARFAEVADFGETLPPRGERGFAISVGDPLRSQYELLALDAEGNEIGRKALVTQWMAAPNRVSLPGLSEVMGVSPNGRTVYLAQSGVNSLVAVDGKTLARREVAKDKFLEAPTAIAVLPTSGVVCVAAGKRYVAIEGGSDGILSEWNLDFRAASIAGTDDVVVVSMKDVSTKGAFMILNVKDGSSQFADLGSLGVAPSDGIVGGNVAIVGHMLLFTTVPSSLWIVDISPLLQSRRGPDPKAVRVPVSPGAWTVMVSPDGRTAYVGNNGGSADVVDIPSRGRTPISPRLAPSPRSAVSPDGSRILVPAAAHYTGMVSVSDIRTGALVQDIQLAGALAVTASPDGARTFVACVGGLAVLNPQFTAPIAS